MKATKYLIVVLVGLSLLWIGCEEEPSESLEAPTNLRVTSVEPDGTTLNLAWTASQTSDVDGYYVYFDDSLITELSSTATSYQLPTDRLGEIGVSAFRGGEESAKAILNTEDELVYGNSGGPIYWENDETPGHYSGFGWDEDGTGAIYSLVSEYKPYIDIYVDSDFDLGSPTNISGWEDAHSTGFCWDFTSASSLDDVTNVAGADFSHTYADIYEGAIYVLELQSGNYVKIKVVGVNETDHSIQLEYYFMAIPDYAIMY